jgi:hypothetical protein
MLHLNSNRIVLAFIAFFIRCSYYDYPHNYETHENPVSWSNDAVVILEDSLWCDAQRRQNGNVLFVKSKTLFYLNGENVPANFRYMSIRDFPYIEEIPRIQLSIDNGDGAMTKVSDLEIKRKPVNDFRYNLSVHATNEFISSYVLPRCRKGMKVERILRRVFTKPEFYSRFDLVDEWDCRNRFLKFSWPSAMLPKFGLVNEEGVPVNTTCGGFEGRQLFSISLTNIAKRSSRYVLKNPQSWNAAFQFCVPPVGDSAMSWKSLGDYYLQTVNDGVTIDSTFSTFASFFAKTEPKDVVDGAFEFVKRRIRYYGNFEKNHGHVPRKPREVLEKGYGDCKEMSFLLVLLLRQFHVSAYPAITESFGCFQPLPDFPSLAFGNHMVAYVENPDGSALFLDPTNKIAGKSESCYPLLYQTALVLKNGESKLCQILPEKSATNDIITISTIEKDRQTGKWVLLGEIRFSGIAAFEVYSSLNFNGASQSDKILSKVLNAYFALKADTASIVSMTIDSVYVKYRCDFQKNVIIAEKIGFIMTLPGQFRSEVENYDEEPRLAPLFITGFRQYDRWRLPLALSESSFENIDNGFVKTTWTNKKNSIERTIVVPTQTVEPSIRQKFNNAMKERAHYERTIVWSK